MTRNTKTTDSRPRRRKGEGSVRPRPGGRYEVRFTNDLGARDSATFPTEAQAVAFLTKANAARISGSVIGADRQLLGDYLADWLSTHVVGVARPATASAYERAVRLHLTPTLGRVRLADLRDTHVRTLQATMAAKGLSPATIKLAQAVLGVALAKAVEGHRVAVNVAHMVSLPTVAPRTIKGVAIVPPTMAELGAVIAELDDDHALMLRLTLATGARIGELQALRWGRLQIDGPKATVTIDASWNDEADQLGPTKSKAGVRTIAINAQMAKRLRGHRAGQTVVGIEGFVFPSRRDPTRPANDQTMRDALAVAQLRAGVRAFRWHDIRHAAITARREAGQDLLDLSRWAGHSRIQVTADLYGHVNVSDLPAMPELATSIRRNNR